MQTLFWIAWVVLLLILLVCLYETFAVSSNSRLAVPSFIVSVLLIGALVFRNSHPKLAYTLLLVPVGLSLLFLVYFLFMASNPNNWR